MVCRTRETKGTVRSLFPGEGENTTTPGGGIMRMHIPKVKARRPVVALLNEAFVTENMDHVRKAIRLLAAEYHLPLPRLYFRNRLRGAVAGLCYEDGRLDLLKPKGWKAEGRTQATWVFVALHEFGHYWLWANAEPKADLFARRWLRAIRP